MLNNYALIIGVEDYSAYDRSTDQPAGTSDVRGAINDARAFFRQCLSMGFSPERIRVLTSPKLSPQDLGPGATEVSVGEATHDAIVAGIRWLAGEISGAAPASGLLTFSGHGLESHGVALCPSDVTASLAQVIHVAAVRRDLGHGKAADNLTMLLDCCHAQAGVSASRTLRALLVRRVAELQFRDTGVAERVIAASRHDQTSMSAVFGGVQLGAFTWAVTSAMGQWATTEERGVARLDVSYGELTARTRGLLSTLSFDQVPVLSGPRGVPSLAFLHPGPKGHPGETSAQPDATRHPMQLNPGEFILLYQDSESNWYTLATIDVKPNPTTGALTEYWNVSTSAAANLGNAQLLRFEQLSSAPPPPTGSVQQTTPAVVTWTSTSNPAYPTAGHTFAGTYTYNRRGATGTLAINFQTQTLRSGADLTQVTYYNPDTSGSNIGLQYSNNLVSMDPVTGRYAGTCDLVTAPMS